MYKRFYLEGIAQLSIFSSLELFWRVAFAIQGT